MSMVSLENLPTGWKVVRLKWALEALESGRREVSETDGFEDGVLSVGGEHIGWQGEWLLEKPRFVSIEFFDAMSAGRIRENDILLVKDGATIGKVAIAKPLPAKNCAVNEHVFLLRVSTENHAKYYFYVVQSSLVQDQIQLEVRGSAQPGLNSEFRNVVIIPNPPRPTQQSIATFLDRETSRIDALIEMKERQIELLQEKRAALISHAVTKGLDAKVKMKDSGVEWLGEIPEHWTTRRMKYLATKIGSGKTPRGGAEVYVDSGVMLLRSQNIHFDGLRLDDVVYIEPEVDAEMGNTRVKPHDVLLNITGASLGRASLVPKGMESANVNQHVCIVRPKAKVVHPEYLFTATCSRLLQSQIFANENGTSREGLNFQQVGDLVVVLPPDIEEQERIARVVQRGTGRIDSSIVVILKSLTLLRDYRTALISAAVTGKIDVRKAVA